MFKATHWQMANLGFPLRSDPFTAQHYCLNAAVLKDAANDLAIVLLGIYPKDTNVVIQRGTCTLVFIAAMSIIAKLWKEPRCPSIAEWIKM